MMTPSLPELLPDLLHDIRACAVCKASLPLGPRPIVQVGRLARVLVVGQAPGRRAHESGLPWNDSSGARLREWMGIDEARFYDPDRVALMPMGFCYPGASERGGDHPPRRECASLWHERLRRHMDEVRLTLLVGQYAQKAYLPDASGATLTDTVLNYERASPGVLPLPHPSWRSTGWMRRNPWFETKLLPTLRAAVAAALGETGTAEAPVAGVEAPGSRCL
jgi:uracil-DNA glycosylase